ncbi:helix-turn-helix transcriptional regulator [Nonomuraea pusilla]|uniref:Regulatory protein, luxR family n=1 Tax=Nonomuraea pusilla TaxID=46177 RepID=A0A1H7INY3_9ACTN|nr:LuxR family transcriptional regulator [Nonomuraea pusilla]SEK63270.1 regulatory protein, luxR family [Nonomuraea pusilla]
MEKGGTAQGSAREHDVSVVGRETETAEILRRIAAGRSHGEVLILTGDPGAGKSVLLGFAAGHVRREGGRVLRALGSESEAHLAFAGLHQLLRPVLGELDGLPPRQRAALGTVLGLEEGTEAPDGMLVGQAVLSLVSDLAEPAPLLMVVDDAQWIDRASLDVLSFVARRMDSEPVTLLVGVRTAAALPGLDKGYRRLELGPLSGEAANRLLDRQPVPPTGRTRVRILQEAAGNPLALVELARAGASLHPGGSGVEGPLPVTDRLERIFAGQAALLPEATRRALLLLAAADGTDAPTASRGLPEAGDRAWAPAERADLVRQDGPRISFRHPLIRSAVYHAASFEERRQAHLALAKLSEEPDRRAWHLAAATTRPDEEVSAALRRTADRARRRGGHAAAAAALQRAAELSPRRSDQARLLTEAAAMAVFTGQLGWVERLAAEVREHSDDPALISRAALATGQLMALRRPHTAAFALLTRIAEQAAATGSPHALDALAAAAVVRYYSGEESQRHRIANLLSALPGSPGSGALHAWVRAVCDPGGAGAALAPALPALIAGAKDDPGSLTALAIVAWVLDETALAARTFDEAHERWQAYGSLPDGLGSAVGWTYLEQGRWAEARSVAAEISATASVAGLGHAEACAHVLDATALALLGEADEARGRAERALVLVDPLESRSVAVFARRALGLAAVAEGDYDTAYAQFRSAFTDDGDPVHYHVSYTVLGELAAAAVRRGRRADAAELLERSARRLGPNRSARIAALLDRGRALLAEPDHAEPCFRAALAGDTGEQWPFERAQTRLEYGEWLRRRRRIAEARPLLTAALDTFRRLGARPWIERAKAELRAAGIEAAGGVVPSAFTELSPQQQQIVRLAARGLTNREIGERLYLSPRTVGSHLYRVFPKLGVTARSQLRDVVEGTLPADRRHDQVPA